MTTAYFIADTHFGHTKIIGFCNRPFANVEEMDNTLIDNWNAVVKPDEDIYILGDFAFIVANKVHAIVTRLNGRKHLIRGNHDRFIKRYDKYADDFVWIKDYAEVEINERRFILFHYPIMEWAGYYRNAIHVYGHVHNQAVAQASVEQLEKAPKQHYTLPGRAVNVGVDVTGFKPISVLDVIRLADENAKIR